MLLYETTGHKGLKYNYLAQRTFRYILLGGISLLCVHVSSLKSVALINKLFYAVVYLHLLKLLKSTN